MAPALAVRVAASSSLRQTAPGSPPGRTPPSGASFPERPPPTQGAARARAPSRARTAGRCGPAPPARRAAASRLAITGTASANALISGLRHQRRSSGWAGRGRRSAACAPRSSSLATRPRRRTCGCRRSRAASGPAPTTSTSAPGYRSSASSRMPTPASASQTADEQAAAASAHSGLPAPGAVLDLRRRFRRVAASGAAGSLRGRGSYDRDLQDLRRGLSPSARVVLRLVLAAHCGRAGGPRRRDSLRRLLLHSWFFAPLFVARHPGRAFFEQLPVGFTTAVAAVERPHGAPSGAAPRRAGRRASARRSPAGARTIRDRPRARTPRARLHRRLQHRHADRARVQRALDHQVVQHVVERARLGVRAGPSRRRRAASRRCGCSRARSRPATARTGRSSRAARSRSRDRLSSQRAHRALGRRLKRSRASAAAMRSMPETSKSVARKRALPRLARKRAWSG